MVRAVTADGAQAGRDPLEAAREAAEAAGERFGQARVDAGERLGQARAEAGERLEAAVGAIKPRLRGVSHQWAFFVSLAAGAVLVMLANGSKATIAAAIYALS